MIFELVIVSFFLFFFSSLILLAKAPNSIGCLPAVLFTMSTKCKLNDFANSGLSSIILLSIQSRYAVVWNSRFHHQDHLDFVKHLINVLMICLKRFRLIANGWLLMTLSLTILEVNNGGMCSNVICCSRLPLWVGNIIYFKFTCVNRLRSKGMWNICYWEKLTFSKLRFYPTENLRKYTSFEEEQGTRYIRGNVYFGIIEFSCALSIKPCFRFLLRW